MNAMNLIRKRGVMIAIAVVALLTLTAGVAAASSNKATFKANGVVQAIGLFHGSSVDSTFNVNKKGKIKSVDIHTVNEFFQGAITDVTKCKEAKKNTAPVCGDLATLLTTGSVFSLHTSDARLRVTKQPHPYSDAIPVEVITGRLRGNLVANFTLADGAVGGVAGLKIRGKMPASYACVVGGTPAAPVFGPIVACQFGPGLLVPFELHVKDTGRFTVNGVDSEIKGKLTVRVDSDPINGVSGTIKIQKGKAEFGH